jgi:HEAT repeat protein
MGLFDFFKKGSSPPPASPAEKKVSGPGKVVADKRAQTYDRAEAIQQLCSIGTPEAAAALLRRFTFSIDPSITDQEEKESAFAGIVEVGEPAVPHILAFCEKAEVLTWPLRMLKDILKEDAYVEELLKLVEGQDTDYSRNVEPKIQLLSALEEVRGDAVREAAERFLEDVNENVRFHAVVATFEQGDEASVSALARALGEEESVRIKNKICDGFVLRAWKLPASQLEGLRKALSDVSEYRVDGEGAVSRR